MRFHKISFFFLVFLFIGCATSFDSQKINIKNHHNTTIMVDVWDLESSNAVDPNPAISVDEVSFLQIRPQESATISKSEIKGYDDSEQIRLFLYEIRRDSAFYQTSFSLSSSQEINILHGADGYYVDSPGLTSL